MTKSLRPAEAEALVAEKRQLLGERGDAHRGELAQALLELSRALQRDDRENDALAAAEESVRVLQPPFLANRAEVAEPMRVALAQYVALAQRLRQGPDETLLAPIAQVMGDHVRGEDDAEDDAP